VAPHRPTPGKSFLQERLPRTPSASIRTQPTCGIDWFALNYLRFALAKSQLTRFQ
jgi:hypothetical protein